MTLRSASDVCNLPGLPRVGGSEPTWRPRGKVPDIHELVRSDVPVLASTCFKAESAPTKFELPGS